MSEKIKTLNIEGGTYVIPGEEPYNPADVTYARDEDTDWNNFQIPEDEYKHVPKPKESNLVEFEKLKRKLDQKIGVGVLSAMSLDDEEVAVA